MVGAPGGGPGGWLGNWLGWGNRASINDVAWAKPGSPDSETRVVSDQELHDARKSLKDPVVARMIRNQNIVRVAVFVAAIALVFLYFFVTMMLD